MFLHQGWPHKKMERLPNNMPDPKCRDSYVRTIPESLQLVVVGEVVVLIVELVELVVVGVVVRLELVELVVVGVVVLIVELVELVSLVVVVSVVFQLVLIAFRT